MDERRSVNDDRIGMCHGRVRLYISEEYLGLPTMTFGWCADFLHHLERPESTDYRG